MSTILKALKKLEENKASEGTRQGDIAWDVLKEPPRGPLQSYRGTLLAVLVVSLAAAALAWHFFIGTSQQTTALQEPPRAQELPEPQQPPVVEITAGEVTAPVSEYSKRRTPHSEATPVTSSSAPAGVKLAVSLIAYQDEPSSRIAIVNDLPVMAGTLIEGCVVEQILEDRVTFSRHGSFFSVPLVSQD